MNNDRIAAADILNGTVSIVAAYVGHNSIPFSEVPAFMRSVATALTSGVILIAEDGAVAVAAEGTPSLAPADAPLAIAATDGGTADTPAVTDASEMADDGATLGSDEGTNGEATAVDPKPYKFAHLSRIPVIPIKDSVRHDEVICLFDGIGKKMLKRHIRARYGMEEDEYRAHFGLPADHPMRAPGYAQEKSLVAKAQGLGTAKISKTPRAERAENVTPLRAAA